MKKSLLLNILLILFGIQLYAGRANAYSDTLSQKTQASKNRFGFRAGLNQAGISTNNSLLNLKRRASFHLGIIFDFKIWESCYLEGGLLYSGKGFKSEYNENWPLIVIQYIHPNTKYAYEYKTTVKPSYVEIPINAVLKLGEEDTKISFFGGAYMSVGIGGTIEAKVSDNYYNIHDISIYKIKFGNSAVDDDMKRFDFGINIGAGLEFRFIQVRAQCGVGLSNISVIKGRETTNNVIGISFIYIR